MELYKFTLTNNTSGYAVGKDEFDARDKITKWVKSRFFQSIQISNMEQIAETDTKGFMEKLVY